ncbi:uncharacterized protein OCT59_019232 [Rhizophagus irregularis]|uniref:uncharacterized protein n=1 Tax=Rhizophagus irregularis TaxID=588596 RepID=UPI00331CC9DC|nr:hypothetical protein OCT59_019232 [Rhizophagus irregularis]
MSTDSLRHKMDAIEEIVLRGKFSPWFLARSKQAFRYATKPLNPRNFRCFGKTRKKSVRSGGNNGRICNDSDRIWLVGPDMLLKASYTSSISGLKSGSPFQHF